MTISKKFEEELSKVEVDRGIEPVKAARRVKPDEALRLIGGECILGGLPMLNVRTRSIEIEGVPIPSNDLSRLYMGLSTPTVIWSKELVVDAVTDVAVKAPALETLKGALPNVLAPKNKLPSLST